MIIYKKLKKHNFNFYSLASAKEEIKKTFQTRINLILEYIFFFSLKSLRQVI
jgi:hypothetical protein